MLGNPYHTVLCHGVFDLLHLGHIRHLQEARKLGDRLIVSITADQYVNKGIGRPRFTAAERREALMALDCVDDVVICGGPDAAALIEEMGPAVYVKGIDYKDANNDALQREIAAIEAAGGKFHVTTTGKISSSSRLINALTLSDEALAWLDGVRGLVWIDKIEEAFAKADKLSIAFIGETIIDEYRYVTPLGRPSKEFILAGLEEMVERYEGGVIAAAKHGEWARTEVVTAPVSICKTRYIDQQNRKLFEVYGSRCVNSRGMAVTISNTAMSNDVVIVFDFGHGMMNGVEVGALGSGKFVAVNAQTNAGNYGFNLVTKYKGANYVCVDEPEARLAIGLPSPIEKTSLDGMFTTTKLGDIMRGSAVIVTHGRHGCHVPGHIPAFAIGGVDTMGAGDAFLAVTAPLVAVGLPMEIVGFVGNVAGAIKTSIVGHRRHVGRQELLQTCKALLS